MCFNLRMEKVKTIRNLMAMDLKVVVAEVIGVYLNELTEQAPKVQKLHINEACAEEVKEFIAEIFDSIGVNPGSLPVRGALVDNVLHSAGKTLMA